MHENLHVIRFHVEEERDIGQGFIRNLLEFIRNETNRNFYAFLSS